MRLELDDASMGRALIDVGEELLHGVFFALCLAFDLQIDRQMNFS